MSLSQDKRIRIQKGLPNQLSLKDILVDISSKSFHAHSSPQERVEIIREAHAAILLLFKGVVPEWDRTRSYTQERERDGFEQCQKEILEAIEKL